MTFREQLEQLDVEFLHGVPVKLPPATITSIINLVDKELPEKKSDDWRVGEYKEWGDGYNKAIDDMRAIIRKS